MCVEAYTCKSASLTERIWLHGMQVQVSMWSFRMRMFTNTLHTNALALACEGNTAVPVCQIIVYSAGAYLNRTTGYCCPSTTPSDVPFHSTIQFLQCKFTCVAAAVYYVCEQEVPTCLPACQSFIGTGASTAHTACPHAQLSHGGEDTSKAGQQAVNDPSVPR